MSRGNVMCPTRSFSPISASARTSCAALAGSCTRPHFYHQPSPPGKCLCVNVHAFNVGPLPVEPFADPTDAAAPHSDSLSLSLSLSLSPSSYLFHAPSLCMCPAKYAPDSQRDVSGGSCTATAPTVWYNLGAPIRIQPLSLRVPPSLSRQPIW